MAKVKPQYISIYETDFGTVILPDDFPGHAMRKRGAVDRRYKIAADLAEYIEDLQEGVKQLWVSGKDVRGMQAMSWREWLKS